MAVSGKSGVKNRRNIENKPIKILFFAKIVVLLNSSAKGCWKIAKGYSRKYFFQKIEKITLLEQIQAREKSLNKIEI